MVIVNSFIPLLTNHEASKSLIYFGSRWLIHFVMIFSTFGSYIASQLKSKKSAVMERKIIIESCLHTKVDRDHEKDIKIDKRSNCLDSTFHCWHRLVRIILSENTFLFSYQRVEAREPKLAAARTGRQKENQEGGRDRGRLKTSVLYEHKYTILVSIHQSIVRNGALLQLKHHTSHTWTWQTDTRISLSKVNANYITHVCVMRWMKLFCSDCVQFVRHVKQLKLLF